MAPLFGARDHFDETDMRGSGTTRDPHSSSNHLSMCEELKSLNDEEEKGENEDGDAFLKKEKRENIKR